jgi:hypothetical protein
MTGSGAPVLEPSNIGWPVRIADAFGGTPEDEKSMVGACVTHKVKRQDVARVQISKCDCAVFSAVAGTSPNSALSHPKNIRCIEATRQTV